MTHPGVGSLTALAYVLIIGTPTRFQRGKQIGTYVFPEASYSVAEVLMEPGDKVLLYTDGILETRSPSEQEFAVDLFKGFLESNHELAADTFVDSRLDELSGWSEHPRGDGQEDDITLLVIDFQSPS